ncbi:MAG: DUF2974 domain-containing protein [Clostridia bacterium]|nr:DUF2974 domain-containing protein [Clostridia bacterium]
MGTLFDYLDWRGDLTFEQCEFGEVDSLILSLVSYLDFYKIVPASPVAKGCAFLAAAKRYAQRHKGEGNVIGLIMPPETVTVTTSAARTVRFGTLRMVGHVNIVDDNIQSQFSATTFLAGEKACFVAFRGTDDTIVGWKESFNMSFLSPIPAQSFAAEYLRHIAIAHPDRKIYLCGHSKGGNLAVYAAVRSSPEVKERIAAVYNNDGPGFDREFIESEEYLAIRDRIRTLVPQSSVVGMLLEHEESYEVVKSNQVGLLQHNGFSWEVMGGRFIHTDSVTEESRYIDLTLKQWLSEMTAEERKHVIDAVYEILASTNAKTLTELSAEKLKVVKAWNTLDPEAKTIVKRMIRLVTKNAKKK